MPGAFHQDFSHRIEARVSRQAGRRRFCRLSRSKTPFRAWMLASAAVIFVASGLDLFLGSIEDVSAKSAPHEEWLPPRSPDPGQTESPLIRKEILRPGDAAVSVLSRLGFSAAEAQRISAVSKSVHPLSRIQAGHAFELHQRAGNTDIFYDIDPMSRLHLFRGVDQTWEAKIEHRKILTRQALVYGTITNSLFEDAATAGLDERTTMNLVDIFAWDIDFARDMRQGDAFRVLYEERFDDTGKRLSNRILAAEFVNQGKVYRAVRYQLEDGREEFFTPDGKSMRKSYLKAPVKYSRISSKFSTHRKHPILGYTRAHRGVDYAAPRGTPVHAVGDGFVTYAGWKGGYGRMVEIRHNNRNHSTRYAHLKGFARGLKKGQKVRQGQVVGYVGASGVATGPHLHFEFRIRGRAINPLSIKRTPAQPVPPDEMARFKEHTSHLMAWFDTGQKLVAWE